MTNLLLSLANSANLIIATNNVTFETNVFESTTEPEKPKGWSEAVYVPPPPTNALVYGNVLRIGRDGWGMAIFSNTFPVIPQEKFVVSNVFKISTFDFEWNGQRRRITDREVVTNSVRRFKLKQEWEEAKQ